MNSVFKSFLRVFLVFLMTFSATFALAQTPQDSADGSLKQIAIEYPSLFTSFFVLILVIPFLTELLKHFIGEGKLPSWCSLVLSWLSGICLSYTSHLLDLGCFGDLSIIQTIVTGLGTGLASNGVYDTGIVKKLISLISGDSGETK